MSSSTPAASGEADRLPHTRFSATVDRFVNRIGSLASWLWLLIIIAIVLNVVSRYALRDNIGQLEELQWHLYSVAFLIGIAYAFVADQHVRVDLIYGNCSARTQAWIDLIGILVFALPFVLVVIRYGIPFTMASYAVGERSDQPSGLPYRYALKAMLPLAFMLLLAAIVARLSRLTSLLFGFPAAIRRS